MLLNFYLLLKARRWAARQKAAFFELSPAEKEMVNADSARASRGKEIDN
jgi:hypothetical protein